MADRTVDLTAAISAVRAAARVCRDVQQRLVSADTLEKKDKTHPVEVVGRDLRRMMKWIDAKEV